MIGLLLQVSGLVLVAVALYGVAVVFHLVTLCLASGLALLVGLFLGAVLSTFLTLGAVYLVVVALFRLAFTGFTTENTLRVFDFIGLPEVPVYRGVDRPLVRMDVLRGMAERILEIYNDFAERGERDGGI